MAIREIIADDLTTLRWIALSPSELASVGWTEAESGWWRIVAELSCHACGAFQAADSDPVNDKSVATTLAVRLFNGVGWRVDEHSRAVCDGCASGCGVDR